MINFSLISPAVEAWINVLLCLIALPGAYYAVQVAQLFGGALGKIWDILAAVASLFALYEIMLSLEGFGIVDFGGIDVLFEIAMAILLFWAFYRAYKILKKEVAAQ
jgi:hypothetical protein